MQEFRYDLARCHPEALTEPFLEMVAAGYEAIDVQARFTRYILAWPPAPFDPDIRPGLEIKPGLWREAAEHAFQHAWTRWTKAEIQGSGCKGECEYGRGCGGYHPQCGGCCACMGGCQVQAENEYVAATMRLDWKTH